MSDQQHPSTDIKALAAEILELSQTYEPPKGGFGSKSQLVQKAEQLIHATYSPIDHAMSLITAMTEASAIRTLQAYKVFDAIPEHQDQGVTVGELEKTTEVQAALLDRLLRILAGSKFIKYDATKKTYAHTSLSLGYASANMAGLLFPTVFDEISLMTRLPAYFKAKGVQEPDGEQASTHNPSSWSAGQEGKTTFEILEQDPEKLAGFVRLMKMAEMFRPWTGFYDYSKLASDEGGRPVLVDVGGADGTCIAKILEAHSEIRPQQCIVQDREKVVAAAEQNDNLPTGVKFSAHDFFTPQPIKHAKAYQLRAICHDWSDTTVIKILKQIVPVMAPDSKVLIADNVLPESGVSGFAAFADLAMMCIGGKERTRANFEAVCDAAGLKVDAVYPAPGEIEFAIVEASLK